MKHHRELIQYVFLDVVDFTKTTRSVEDMVAIINDLNTLVREKLDALSFQKDDENLIIIPTGDGMCIAMLNQKAEATHLMLAQAIRHHVADLRESADHEGRRFQLHIAVHEGKDIIIKDINDRRNIIGAGINRAARIMGHCKGGDLLVSSVVHEGVSRDEPYKGQFKRDEFMDHGEAVICYQLGNGLEGGLKSMLRHFDEASGKVGPLLSMQDIACLKEGDVIWHKVDGRGKIITAGPYQVGSGGRFVTIRFRTHDYPVTLSNEKGNYHRWLGNVGA